MSISKRDTGSLTRLEDQNKISRDRKYTFINPLRFTLILNYSFKLPVRKEMFFKKI